MRHKHSTNRYAFERSGTKQSTEQKRRILCTHTRLLTCSHLSAREDPDIIRDSVGSIRAINPLKKCVRGKGTKIFDKLV